MLNGGGNASKITAQRENNPPSDNPSINRGGNLPNFSTILLQFFLVWKNLVHPDWLGEEL
jgi:hypothetical protein